MQAKRYILPALLLFAAAAFLVMSLRLFGFRQSGMPAAAVAARQSSGAAERLFPEIIPEAITAVSVVTPHAAFDLQREEPHVVSVNGQRGDHEVFATLLEQIADIPFMPTAPFSTQDAPLLTLTIKHRQQQYSAAFYSDGAAGERARIVTHRNQASQYGQTDGWRIGTLMLACEGIRIQDESGKETPLK